MSKFSLDIWASSFLNDCPTKNPDISAMANLLGNKDWLGYLNYQPKTSVDDPDYQYVYLAQKFLSKYEGFGVNARSARETAIRRFWDAETACELTNERFWSSSFTEAEFKLLARMRHFVRMVLGGIHLDAFIGNLDFTDGSDRSNPYGCTSHYLKFLAKPTITRDAAETAKFFLSADPYYAARLAGTTQTPFSDYSHSGVCPVVNEAWYTVGNSVSFVPKTAKTDRAIAVEPSINMLIQRSIGIYIRNRLQKFGVDLIHGQETNADLARLGSARGSVATIDLSMASDTMSRGLVEFALPPLWYRLLDSVRSKWGELGPKKFYYHKFSSMGNGFTFELETLLFWAMVRAVIPDEEWEASKPFVAIYGDDVILPSVYADAWITLASLCGFTTNGDKTFTDGPFRESCGKDYIGGTNVRPFFVKTPLSKKSGAPNKPGLLGLVNSIRHYSKHRAYDNAHRHWLHNHWQSLILQHGLTHHFGPEEYGDTVVQCTRFEAWSVSGHRAKFRRIDGSWKVCRLVPTYDDELLAAFYEKRGFKAQRGHSTALLWLAFRRVQGSCKPYESIVESPDLLQEVGRGAPMRVRSVHTWTSSWED